MGCSPQAAVQPFFKGRREFGAAAHFGTPGTVPASWDWLPIGPGRCPAFRPNANQPARIFVASFGGSRKISFMKNFLIAILAAGVLALGAFSHHQKKEVAELQSQIADVQTQLQKKSGADEAVARAEKKTEVLQATLADTAKFAGEKSKQAEQLQQSLAAVKTNDAASTANPFAKMFKDPAMREMIKSQQKSILGPMINKQYAGFVQQMNMTPEQTATFKELLQKKMGAGMESGMAMMDDSVDATKRAELAKQAKSQTDDYDAQIKQFLGDDSYKAYQDYEKTTPDRTVVGQFSEQLADGATALNPEQQAQLIQAMSEERNGFKWTTDYSNKNPANGDYTAMFTDDKISQFAQEKEKLDQQVFARAQQVLTPEQLKAFQEFQTSQRELQMAGMKMAAKMFAPKSQ